MKKLLSSLLLFVAVTMILQAQQYGALRGTVRDSVGQPVELANVALLGRQEGTMTDTDGFYYLTVPAGRSYTVVISCVGYRTEQIAIRLEAGEIADRNISLRTDVRALKEVSVSARQERASTFHRIDAPALPVREK